MRQRTAAHQAHSAAASARRPSRPKGLDRKVTAVATDHLVVADPVSGSVKQRSAFSVGEIQNTQKAPTPPVDLQELVAARIAEALVTDLVPIKVIQV